MSDNRMMQFVFAATSNQWIFSLIVPLKFSLSAMEAHGGLFCVMNAACGSRFNLQRGHQD
jgi:hypothetical protein